MRIHRPDQISLMLGIMALTALIAMPGHSTARAQNSSAEAAQAELPRPSPLSRQQELAACVALWEPATHMTKALWIAVCKRLDRRPPSL